MVHQSSNRSRCALTIASRTQDQHPTLPRSGGSDRFVGRGERVRCSTVTSKILLSVSLQLLSWSDNPEDWCSVPQQPQQQRRRRENFEKSTSSVRFGNVGGRVRDRTRPQNFLARLRRARDFFLIPTTESAIPTAEIADPPYPHHPQGGFI